MTKKTYTLLERIFVTQSLINKVAKNMPCLSRPISMIVRL